jgi:hypothetical protein
MSPRCRRAAEAGSSLLELVLVLGLMAVLTGMGAGRGLQDHGALTAAQGELRASVEQAFLLARARGCSVVVALAGHSAACRGRHPRAEHGAIAPLTLPGRVRWGLPESGVPLPPDARNPLQAHRTGMAKPCITITPEHTAEANAWYLSDGQDAVYLGLSDSGRITLQRWRNTTRQWRKF